MLHTSFVVLGTLAASVSLAHATSQLGRRFRPVTDALIIGEEVSVRRI